MCQAWLHFAAGSQQLWRFRSCALGSLSSSACLGSLPPWLAAACARRWPSRCAQSQLHAALATRPAADRFQGPHSPALHSLLHPFDAPTKNTSFCSAAVRGRLPALIHSTAPAVKPTVTSRLCMRQHALQSFGRLSLSPRRHDLAWHCASCCLSAECRCHACRSSLCGATSTL